MSEHRPPAPKSTPPSQALSAHSHALSSFSSSPSSQDHLDSTAGSSKLPRLTEDPREGRFPHLWGDGSEGTLSSWCLCSIVEGCPHGDSKASYSTSSLASPAFEAADNLFGDDDESHYLPRRRKSGDSTAGVASRVGERLPSLSRKWRGLKTASALSKQSTHSSTPSGGRSSRASSTAGSVVPSVNVSLTDLPQSPARLSVKQHDEPTPASLVGIVMPDMVPLDGERLGSTPLLPPVRCGKLLSLEQDWQSPLQSPTVAGSSATFSAMNSPAGTPQTPVMQTPPLSTQPSIASISRGHAGSMVPNSDIPPISIGNQEDSEQDEWAERLGHANFTILPKPYMPVACDRDVCRELCLSWEQARLNFIKHLVRTGEHYGATSKTYGLTKQKWAEIDSQWMSLYDAARTADDGLEHATAPTPSEPPPLMMMMLPALEDPKKPGQFPKLGDEDIVGPMVQAAARTLPRSSKKQSWAKLLSPGGFFGRPTQLMGVRAGST